MSVFAWLKRVPLFAALDEGELLQVAAICSERTANAGDIILRQNTKGDSMYVIGEGSVEVFTDGKGGRRPLVVLGIGQVVGEMALIDHGYRSASVRATQEGCSFVEIDRVAFNTLCHENARIGYIVMRNLAIDLAFKLRHQNMAER
jgi:CRP/FNR family cyclic AMP-dependent transcriptional regulator